MKNTFLKQVRRDKRNVLCVAVGTAKLKNSGTLTTNTIVAGEGGVTESEASLFILVFISAHVDAEM